MSLNSKSLFRYFLSQTDCCDPEAEVCVNAAVCGSVEHYRIPNWVSTSDDLDRLSLAREVCNPFLPLDKWEMLICEDLINANRIDDILAYAFRINALSCTLANVEIQSKQILDFEKIREALMAGLMEGGSNRFISDNASVPLNVKDNKV